MRRSYDATPTFPLSRDSPATTGIFEGNNYSPDTFLRIDVCSMPKRARDLTPLAKRTEFNQRYSMRLNIPIAYITILDNRYN